MEVSTKSSAHAKTRVRIMAHLEGYLDKVLRGASDLYPAEPPFEGLNALIMPKGDLQVPSKVCALSSP